MAGTYTDRDRARQRQRQRQNVRETEATTQTETECAGDEIVHETGRVSGGWIPVLFFRSALTKPTDR